MRIMHLITTLSVGGAETNLYRLLSKTDLSIFKTEVVSLTDKGIIGEKIMSLGVPVHALGLQIGVPNLLSIGRLVRRIRQHRPHIIQAWMYHANILGLLATKLNKLPTLVWNIRCSDIPFSNYRPQTGWIVKLCANLSAIPDAIIINSRKGMNEHIKLGYKSDRMLYIPNGIDPDLFRPNPEARRFVRRELGLPKDATIVGFVARWDPLKDHTTFIQAAALLSREHEHTYFLLIGKDIDWDTPQLASLIKDAGLQDRMFLLGLRDDISRMTAAVDIACSSSVTEGFPTTVLEAMACGVPCVVTDVGDSASIVGDTGFAVPSRNPDALAKAWASLLTMDVDKRRDLGVTARNRVISRFSLEKVTRQYESLYYELGNNSPRH